MALSSMTERKIVRSITSGLLDTAVHVQKDLQIHDQVTVSAQTIRNSLSKAGMKSASKKKKPLLIQGIEDFDSNLPNVIKIEL